MTKIDCQRCGVMQADVVINNEYVCLSCVDGDLTDEQVRQEIERKNNGRTSEPNTGH